MRTRSAKTATGSPKPSARNLPARSRPPPPTIDDCVVVSQDIETPIAVIDRAETVTCSPGSETLAAAALVTLRDVGIGDLTSGEGII